MASIYLDYNASTPVDPAVAAAMRPFSGLAQSSSWSRLGRLRGYRLVFTVGGGMRPGLSAPANIVAAPDATVHGVLYRLPLRQFVRLDAGEGRQYGYLWTEAEDAGGNRRAVVTYKVVQAAPEGRPWRSYLNTIREAARQRGLPEDYIASLDRVEARE